MTANNATAANEKKNRQKFETIYLMHQIFQFICQIHVTIVDVVHSFIRSFVWSVGYVVARLVSFFSDVFYWRLQHNLVNGDKQTALNTQIWTQLRSIWCCETENLAERLNLTRYVTIS